jgi:hypothetical protein
LQKRLKTGFADSIMYEGGREMTTKKQDRLEAQVKTYCARGRADAGLTVIDGTPVCLWCAYVNYGRDCHNNPLAERLWDDGLMGCAYNGSSLADVVRLHNYKGEENGKRNKN